MEKKQLKSFSFSFKVTTGLGEGAVTYRLCVNGMEQKESPRSGLYCNIVYEYNSLINAMPMPNMQTKRLRICLVCEEAVIVVVVSL